MKVAEAAYWHTSNQGLGSGTTVPATIIHYLSATDSVILPRELPTDIRDILLFHVAPPEEIYAKIIAFAEKHMRDNDLLPTEVTRDRHLTMLKKLKES